jgi:hypothetical protein
MNISDFLFGHQVELEEINKIQKHITEKPLKNE